MPVLGQVSSRSFPPLGMTSTFDALRTEPAWLEGWIRLPSREPVEAFWIVLHVDREGNVDVVRLPRQRHLKVERGRADEAELHVLPELQ